jgi:glutamate synthase domain-containing protein 3
MTGGEAYVWDPQGRLASRVNPALVEPTRPNGGELHELRWLVEQHLDLTGSMRAADLLADWPQSSGQFWHIVPLGRVKRLEAQNVGRVAAAV